MFGVRTFFSFQLSMDFVVEHISSCGSIDVQFCSMLYHLLCWFDQKLVQWVSKYGGVIVCYFNLATFERILITTHFAKSYYHFRSSCSAFEFILQQSERKFEIDALIGCFTCGVLHKSFWHTDCPKFTNYTIYHDARIWTITSTSISCNIFGIVILTTSNIIYIIILHFNFSPHLFFTTLIWIVFHWHSQFRFFVINNLAWQIEQFDFFFDLIIWCHNKIRRRPWCL